MLLNGVANFDVVAAAVAAAAAVAVNRILDLALAIFSANQSLSLCTIQYGGRRKTSKQLAISTRDPCNSSTQTWS